MKLLLVLAALVGVSLAGLHRSLQSDLHEFASKIPLDKIREVAQRYLHTDPEFQAVVAYLQGPEWTKLTNEVKAKPAVQKFFQYMKQSGIDLEAIFDKMHGIIAGAQPMQVGLAPRSLRLFMDEINKLIPKTELIVLLNQKMNNSKDFQEFFAKISSKESRQLFEEVRAIPEVLRIVESLKGMGLKLDEAMQMMYKIFGWN